MVTRPKLDELTEADGLLKLAWLSRLNASARTCSDCDSLRIAIERTSEKSKAAKPGPCRKLRSDVPYVPSAFNANACVLNHCCNDWALVRLPEKDGLPTRSARSLPIPLSESSIPELMVNGSPLRRLRIPLVSHPPSTVRATAPIPTGVGMRHA